MMSDKGDVTHMSKLNLLSSSSRRDFLRNSFLMLAALPVLGTVFTSCTKKGANPPEGTTAVKEDDPVAASLGYKHEASAVDTSKFPKRAGAEGAQQFCHNCQFYTARGDSGWGDCSIIRSGVVKAEGWCNTWAKKA